MMKIKEAKEIPVYKKIPLIFFLCCSATIIIRIVLVFSYTDRETGFLTGGNLLKTVLYLLIGVACVFFAVVAYAGNETKNVTLKFKKDKLLTVITTLTAVGLLYDSVSALLGSITSISTISYGLSAFQSMMLSGTIPQFLQSIFAALSALYFLFFAKNSDCICNHKALAVAPVGWASFRLIHRFVEQISYIRVSELLLELVLLGLFVLFFMAFAQTASGVYVKNARWRIIGVGLPAALVSFALNLPRLIFVILNGSDALYSKYPFKFSDFILAIFITVIAFKLIKKENEPCFEA